MRDLRDDHATFLSLDWPDIANAAAATPAVVKVPTAVLKVSRCSESLGLAYRACTRVVAC